MSSHFSSFIITCVIIFNMEDFLNERLSLWERSFLGSFKNKGCKSLLILQIGRLRYSKGRKVPDFRLEPNWPFHTVPPKPDSKATHSFHDAFRSDGDPHISPVSEFALNVIPRMWRLWYSPCTKARIHHHQCSSWQPLLGSSLCQPRAEHLSLMDPCLHWYSWEPYSGVDSLTGWHADWGSDSCDFSQGIMVNMCQNQNF